jgi:hypothetical protein
MKENKLDNFNFYREAKLNYRHIVPSREDGLILFYLYEKLEKDEYSNGEFSEPEIISAIEHVYVDVKGDSQKRNEFERNNDTILRLQEFFLWRNAGKKTYRFKGYGIEFCKNIKTQLENFYSPTEIKAIFDSLVHELTLAKEDELQFSQWIKLHFDQRSPDLSRQVEILDQQVSDAVKLFRTRIVAAGIDINDVISEALDSLNGIKTSSDEFRNAFHATYEIEDCLLYILENRTLSDETMLKIRRVREFINKIRDNLELVSKRIDQIQPRIREFIHNFNQQDFDRKTELFLKYLLKNVKKKNPVIEPFYIKNSTPTLPIILKKNIGLSRPIAIEIPAINQEKRNISRKALEKKQLIRKQVLYWMNQVQKNIDSGEEFLFSKFLYKILSEEKDYQLTIAVKVSHKVVLQYSRHRDYDVNIDKTFFTDDSNKNVRTWKMSIQKKQISLIVS